MKIDTTAKGLTVTWEDDNGQHVARIKNLLGDGDANVKTAKNDAPSWGWSATPHMVKHLGRPMGNACPFAKYCVETCLNHTGNGYMSSVQKARLARRIVWQLERPLFYRLLHAELAGHSARCEAMGVVGKVRLNMFTDIRHELHLNLAAYGGLDFYDYTKWPTDRRPTPTGLHLTQSYDGPHTLETCKAALEVGRNVAVIFHDGLMDGRCGKGAKHQPLPATLWGRPVIDGNITDDRTTDPVGVIVGLTLKARTKAARAKAMASPSTVLCTEEGASL